MRIGIDARFFNESGVGRYLRNLINHLQNLDRKNEYFIFLLPKDLKHFEQKKNFLGILADFTWYGFAEQFKLPQLLNKYKLDLVHFPHFNVPIFYNGKFVVTIHDLIHQHHTMKRATTLDPLTYKIKQFGYRKIFKTAVSRSRKILVPSKSVQQLLINEWKVAKDKIIVTPEAVDGKILSIAKNLSKVSSLKVLDKLHVNPPFIFYVGNAHPHKNIEGLIKVFGEIRAKYQSLQLVLSGHDHYFWERLKREFQHEDIIYTGWISDEEMVALYKNAEMSVMPSFEEGFGIPLLEAMACGCIVVSSNGGSLPEVGGNAAIYFDPYNLDDMGNKIDKVLNSKELRDDLIKKGRKRIKLYSWEKLARQTLEVYYACCNSA